MYARIHTSVLGGCGLWTVECGLQYGSLTKLVENFPEANDTRVVTSGSRPSTFLPFQGRISVSRLQLKL